MVFIGSAISSTVRAGAGKDTIKMSFSGSGGSVAGQFYGDLGNDNITIGTAFGTGTIYGDNSATGTGGGNDTISAATLTSGVVVYAGSGNDTLSVQTATSSTLYGGDGTDTLAINNGTANRAYLDAGADTITVGSSSSTIYGGAGTDEIQVGAVASLKLYGEADNDTFTAGGNVLTSTIVGGAGADVYTVSGGFVSSSKISGGTGNDSVNFGQSATTGALATTIYFGYGDGNDSIAFGANATSLIVGSYVVAVDSQYGATSSYGISGAAGATSRTVTFGAGDKQGSMAFSNLFTSTGGGFLSAQGVTFTTVSTSTITALG
jgi:Ca2+-binding RTX toxin-like protein